MISSETFLFGVGSKQIRWISGMLERGELRRESTERGTPGPEHLCMSAQPHLPAVALGLDIWRQLCLDQYNMTVDPEVYVVYEDFTFQPS